MSPRIFTPVTREERTATAHARNTPSLRSLRGKARMVLATATPQRSSRGSREILYSTLH